MTGRRLQGKIGGLLCGGATYSVQLSSRATKPSGVAITRQFDTGSRVEHYPKLLGRSAGEGGLCQNQVDFRLAEPAARWLHCVQVLGWRLEMSSEVQTADLTCPEEVVAASVARLLCSREARRPNP
jgi:hypothetical protein